MAKDRTRHARRREPERVGVPLIELVRWAIEGGEQLLWLDSRNAR